MERFERQMPNPTAYGGGDMHNKMEQHFPPHRQAHFAARSGVGGRGGGQDCLILQMFGWALHAIGIFFVY